MLGCCSHSVSLQRAAEATDLPLGRSLVDPDVGARLDVNRVGGCAAAWTFEVVSAYACAEPLEPWASLSSRRRPIRDGRAVSTHTPRSHPAGRRSAKDQESAFLTRCSPNETKSMDHRMQDCCSARGRRGSREALTGVGGCVTFPYRECAFLARPSAYDAVVRRPAAVTATSRPTAALVDTCLRPSTREHRTRQACLGWRSLCSNSPR